MVATRSGCSARCSCTGGHGPCARGASRRAWLERSRRRPAGAGSGPRRPGPAPSLRDDADEAANLAAEQWSWGPSSGGCRRSSPAPTWRRSPATARRRAPRAEAATTARQRRDRPAWPRRSSGWPLPSRSGRPTTSTRRRPCGRRSGHPSGSRASSWPLARSPDVPGREHQAAALADPSPGARLPAPGRRGHRPDVPPRGTAPHAGDHRRSAGFAVRRAGQAVPHTAWQSRKARDLLKVLVARRGAPVPRDQLLDAAVARRGPGQGDPTAVGHAVHAARGARSGAERDRRPLGRRRQPVDAPRPRPRRDRRRTVPRGCRAGAPLPGGPDQVAALLAAEAEYVGDLLEEDLYEEWVVPLREWARDTYLRVARALSEHATERGDHDAAARFHRRVLERDRYDEGAHLGLVRSLAAGRTPRRAPAAPTGPTCSGWASSTWRQCRTPRQAATRTTPEHRGGGWRGGDLRRARVGPGAGRARHPRWVAG